MCALKNFCRLFKHKNMSPNYYNKARCRSCKRYVPIGYVGSHNVYHYCIREGIYIPCEDDPSDCIYYKPKETKNK